MLFVFSCNFLHNFLLFFSLLTLCPTSDISYIDDFTLNTPHPSHCVILPVPLPPPYLLLHPCSLYSYALLAPHIFSSIVFIDIFYPDVNFLRPSHFIFHSVLFILQQDTFPTFLSPCAPLSRFTLMS